MASPTTPKEDCGCTFEELCSRSKKGYACDNTVNIGNLSFEEAKEKLIKHIDNCIRRLEIKSGQTVKKLYIGKTYVRRLKTAQGAYLPLDPQNSSTYKKGGISNHWGRQKKAGRDGMVVLTIVTSDAVRGAEQQSPHQEDYTCTLKCALLDHYFKTTTSNKKRVANESPSHGKRDYENSAAYTLYMAYSWEEPQPDYSNKEDGDATDEERLADQLVEDSDEELEEDSEEESKRSISSEENSVDEVDESTEKQSDEESEEGEIQQLAKKLEYLSTSS